MEIVKNEHEEEREGRDGRVRTSQRVEWFVVEGGNLLATFDTKKEAKAFVERQTVKK